MGTRSIIDPIGTCSKLERTLFQSLLEHVLAMHFFGTVPIFGTRSKAEQFLEHVPKWNCSELFPKGTFGTCMEHVPKRN